jgi:GNAT superfamily N-acetyltransferase
LNIELLTSSDIPEAMRLVETAGWNQTPADWQRLIDYAPAGCFKAVLDGTLVGTVTTTAYGQEIGWIGMMLVAPESRRKGIGTMLMQKAMVQLQSVGINTIWLDATPMGQPVYEKLGFQHLYSFHRWHRPAPINDIKSDHYSKEKTAVDIPPEISDRHLQLDQMIFGHDRRDWLRRLLTHTKIHLTEQGFGLIRRGRLAHYLGPVVADDHYSAIEITESLIREIQADIFIDYPGHDAGFKDFLNRSGFSPVRTLARMWHGQQPIENAFQLQFAIADPATG